MREGQEEIRKPHMHQETKENLYYHSHCEEKPLDIGYILVATSELSCHPRMSANTALTKNQ